MGMFKLQGRNNGGQYSYIYIYMLYNCKVLVIITMLLSLSYQRPASSLLQVLYIPFLFLIFFLNPPVLPLTFHQQLVDLKMFRQRLSGRLAHGVGDPRAAPPQLLPNCPFSPARLAEGLIAHGVGGPRAWPPRGELPHIATLSATRFVFANVTTSMWSFGNTLSK